MRIDEILARSCPVFSFEFFPPRTDEGTKELFGAISQLASLRPDFVSVTYGANGSTRTRTLELVTRIRAELGIEPMAHFTCVGATEAELRNLLDKIAASGIDNVLALRGDPPNGTTEFEPLPGGLEHGSDVAQLVSDNYSMCVGGACYPELHPETKSWDDELRHTKIKVEAGAKFLITQLFFDNRAYFAFVERVRAAGINVPIIPGIMPITNVGQIQRFVSKIGVAIPAELMEPLEERREDPEAVVQLGVAWATLQCNELLAAGVPGIHFYTLNRSPSTRAILTALRIAKPWTAVGKRLQTTVTTA